MKCYDAVLKEQLRDVILEKSLRRGTITLSSGKKSDYYIDIRKTSLDSTGVTLCAQLFHPFLNDVEAVGGPTLGADPFLGALLFQARTQQQLLWGFIVRKEKKAHGMQNDVEGPIQKGAVVAIIEDVITSGSSVLKAIQTATAVGLQVKKVLAVIDREEGGRTLLSEKGIDYYPIFTVSELLIN